MRRHGVAAVLALVAGSLCGVAVILSTAGSRTELENGIDSNLAV